MIITAELILGAAVLVTLICVFLLADDIADMREELSLLNKRRDQGSYGDVPHVPTGLHHPVTTVTGAQDNDA